MTSSSSISAFMNTPSRGWMVVIGDKEYPAELIPGSYVSKLFHLLRFRLDETRRTAAVIVACDAIDEDAYRRLAVKLRVSAKEVVHAD